MSGYDASEWKQGDVAMVCRSDDASHRTAHRAFLTEEDGWVCASAGTACAFPAIRPLVVIDPEDIYQVCHLATIFYTLETKPGEDATQMVGDRLQRALREFARPSLRTEEPLGLGAVVEDADGHRWVRVLPDGGPAKWCRSTLKPIERFYVWSAVPATRILSPGIEAES